MVYANIYIYIGSYKVSTKRNLMEPMGRANLGAREDTSETAPNPVKCAPNVHTSQVHKISKSLHASFLHMPAVSYLLNRRPP